MFPARVSCVASSLLRPRVATVADPAPVFLTLRAHAQAVDHLNRANPAMLVTVCYTSLHDRPGLHDQRLGVR
jgi:hypothetical protein